MLDEVYFSIMKARAYHGVRCKREVVVHDNSNGSTGAKVINVPFRLWIESASLGVQEEGLRVVATECLVVDDPDKVSAIVGDVKVKLLGHKFANWVSANWEERFLLGKSVILASLDSCRGDGRIGSWNGVLISPIVIDCGQSIW